MQLILLVVQIILAIALIISVLVQRTSSDGLSGLGGGSSGGHNVMSGRTSANFLTRTTSILAVLFMANCLFLANITARETRSNSIIEEIKTKQEKKKSVTPSVPMAK